MSEADFEAGVMGSNVEGDRGLTALFLLPLGTATATSPSLSLVRVRATEGWRSCLAGVFSVR
jgi:hypothetical protein